MNKFFIFFLITIAFIVSGCTGGGSGGSGSYNLDSFNGGESALTIEFSENAPPETVRDQGQQPFIVRLSIKNEGEHDIKEGTGHVKLRGFDPETLGLTETSKPLPNINGIKKQRNGDVIPGGQAQIIFNDLKYMDSVVASSIPLNIYANICYPYQTRAVAIVCVNGNTNPSLDENVEICQLDKINEYSNSGAPVQIENVKQYPYGQSSIQLQFDIVHYPTSEDANIYQSGSVDSNCNVNGFAPSSSEAFNLKDRVKYTVETGLDGLDCESTGTNSNTVTLIEGGSYPVTCIQDTSGEDEYEKPITFFLDYDYYDRNKVTVNVEHIG